MIRNYLLIIFRTLWKQKFYTFINLVGLSVGVAACLTITLFVANEISYDRYLPNSDRIYRLHTEIKFGDNHFKVAAGYSALAELFRQNYPEVENVARIKDWGKRLVRKIDQTEKTRENAPWADSTFFKVFKYKVLEGDGNSALKEAHSLAISQRMAEKYFPGISPLGQTLILDDNDVCKITAVYENIPQNSHFHFDMLRSLSGNEEAKSVSLIGGGESHVYVLLREGADGKDMEAKFPTFIEKYVGPQIAEAVGGDPTLKKFKEAGNIWEYTLMPMPDIHLHSSLLGEFEPNGNINYVYLFSAIALFILVIACINFMNLSTARSANRAKEVGIRKALGSQRGQLMNQFLSESFVLTMFSIILAIGIVYLFLPSFNNLANKQLSLPFSNPAFYGLLFSAAALISFMAGMYPAFYLSAFRPVLVLKSNVTRGMKGGGIRSLLVVFQFVVSIFLIVATITIQQQLSYIQSKKLGFEKDQLVTVHETRLLGDKIQSFREEVMRNSMIVSGTISGYLPVADSWRGSDTYWKGEAVPPANEIEKLVNMQVWDVDLDYLKTLQMNVKQGRWFSSEFPSDSTAVILNETAIRRFKMEGELEGIKVTHFNGNKPDGSPDPEKVEHFHVIGMVEDFHFASMRDNIGPLAFRLRKNNGRVTFRFDPSRTADVITLLETEWNKFSPDNALQYSFLDDDFAKMYSAEQKLGNTFSLFAGLAILIACLGLFALTAFTAEQRTKEIGIRKALGATVSNIILLLSRDFGKLILVAFLISIPISWYAVAQWLKTFAYKTEVGISVFALAGIITLVIAMITMSYQSAKAARSNPVNSLRSE